MADDRALTRRIRRLNLTENRYEPYQVPRGRVGARILTISDALSFLKEVEETFPDKREKYEEFRQMMTDYKNNGSNVAWVVARVRELFKGHKNLIIGFNTFLPENHKISLTDIEEDIRFEKALMFVNKVKTRFGVDGQVYKSFLDILQQYGTKQKRGHEVCREIAALFMNHPDLFDEFMRCLPRD